MTTGSKPRLVIDTNVLISALLFKGETVREVLVAALDEYQLVFSQTTWDELAHVIQRPGFDKKMPIGSRLSVLAALAARVEVVHSTSDVTDCRDPKDNKFLSVALDADVKAIVSGDGDLLVMHPYKGVAIYSPADFLRKIRPAPP